MALQQARQRLTATGGYRREEEERSGGAEKSGAYLTRQARKPKRRPGRGGFPSCAGSGRAVALCSFLFPRRLCSCVASAAAGLLPPGVFGLVLRWRLLLAVRRRLRRSGLLLLPGL